MPDTKRDRQAAIREIVDTRAVASQEELRGLLRQRGWDVTQSTLSRDLRELRLARVPTPDGLRYVSTAAVGAGVGSHGGGSDGGGDGDERTALDSLLPALFDRVDGVGELVVLHTVIGGAQPVAVALDTESWPDVLGTIAGDDTILMICRSAQARERVMRRLKSIAGRSG
jgi:transcriptional regulator of arginine metabolism